MSTHSFQDTESLGDAGSRARAVSAAEGVAPPIKPPEDNHLSRAAASLAHDLNNLLSVMATVRELLEEETRTMPRLEGYFREMAQAQGSAAELCRELMCLCSPKATQVHSLCLVEALKKAQGVFQRILGRSIVLSMELPRENLAVAVDATVFEMMLVNLVVNARDAMPGGGYVWIRLNRLCGPPSPGEGGAPTGGQVCLQITDTGCGMSRDVQEKIFFPFYTTKAQGNGLGLSMLHQQMMECGGSITVKSKPGEGSTFSLIFPLVTGVEEVSFDPAESVNRNLRGVTVLLVEHHPALRNMLARQLQQRGAQVLKAAGAEDAANYLKTYTSPIHLLMCDVCLPKVSGVDVAEYAMSQRPGIGVLFTSGQLPDAAVNQWLNKWGGEFVLKPFSQEELLGKIHLVLGAPPPAAGLGEG